MSNSKREQFFATALKLFYEKGFKATTMRKIAEEMSFDVANIYNYIESKQSLLESFLFGISKEFHSGVDNIMASSYSPREKLKAVISLNVQLTSQRPFEIALLVNEWRHLKAPKLEAFIAERTAYENKVRTILQEGIHTQQFRKMDLEIATHAVLSCVRWLHDKYTNPEKKINPVELEKQL